MPLIRILASSFVLSFPVLLRMLPIFAATGVVVFGAVSGLIEHPGYLAFVTAITIFPLLAFLQICAIRAGLVHRRQSRGPELGQLVRKSLWLGLVQAGLFLAYAMLLAGALAVAFNPQSLGEWSEAAGALAIAQAEPGGFLAAVWRLNPVLFAGISGSLLIYSALQIALGIPFAAHGAAAAVNGPRHEFLYGAGRRFLPLAVVFVACAAVSWAAGPVISALVLGGALPDFSSLEGGGMVAALTSRLAAWTAAHALVGAWTFSWFAAACAVAYVDIRDTIEAEFQEAFGAIRASAQPPADLAGMMRERNERLRRATPAGAAVLVQETAPAEADEEPDEPADFQHSDDRTPLTLGPDLRDDEAGDEPRMPYPEDEVSEATDTAEDDEVAPPPGERSTDSPMSQDEVEARFSSRFGGERGTGLRDDIAAALREAATLDAAPPDQEPAGPADYAASDVLPGTPGAPLEAEQIPPVVPDLHEAAPEGEDVPEWMQKYFGSDGDKTLFGGERKKPKA